MVQLLLYQQSLMKVTGKTNKNNTVKIVCKKLQFLKTGKKGSCILRWLLAF